MRRFHSPGQAGRFCHAHDPIYGHFRPPQHQLTAAAHQPPSPTATALGTRSPPSSWRNRPPPRPDPPSQPPISHVRPHLTTNNLTMPAKQLLSKLDVMDPESAEFASLFEQLRVAVLAHAAAEEADEFPGLRSSTGESERRVMAMALRAAEAIAPTHPHMNANPAVANLALGPLASVTDQTRDVVREVLERARRSGQN